jgi:hypothetical protein
VPIAWGEHEKKSMKAFSSASNDFQHPTTTLSFPSFDVNVKSSSEINLISIFCALKRLSHSSFKPSKTQQQHWYSVSVIVCIYTSSIHGPPRALTSKDEDLILEIFERNPLPTLGEKGY